MSSRKTGWDIFFIILSCVLVLALLVILYIPFTQGFNPFKLIFNADSKYNFIEDEQYRNTNILEGLAGEINPYIYPMSMMEDDNFEYLDSGKKNIAFKECNSYQLFIEAYNKPKFSSAGVEIYGPFGVEFKIPSVELSAKESEIMNQIQSIYSDSLLVPYYVSEENGSTYISAIDLSASSIKLEKLNSPQNTVISTVSGSTWQAILNSGRDVAILRNADNSLVFDSGEYRLSIMLKQVQIDDSKGTPALKVMLPKNSLCEFSVNVHDCANGIIIANNAWENKDIQLNVINEDTTVCYSPESKINVGKSLNLGVSLSESRYKKLCGIAAKINVNASIEIYRLDPIKNEYDLIENRDIMEWNSIYMNKAFTFEGENYKSGKYRIVVNYDSWLEHIEQEYEYYFTFER